MIDRPTRLRYSEVAYFVWYVLAGLAAVASIWTMLFSEWGWALGWGVGALTLSAHARLERLDGHSHRGGVDVP